MEEMEKMEEKKYKVKLDWKVPSLIKIGDYVKTLEQDKIDAFAKYCVEEKDGEYLRVYHKSQKSI